MVIVYLPWQATDSTTMSYFPFSEYLDKIHNNKENPMDKKDIIIQLESAIYDKDWDAILLLLEELQSDTSFDDYYETDDLIEY